MTKKCKLCQIERPTTEFYVDLRMKSGCSSYCKDCTTHKKYTWYQKNKLINKKTRDKWLDQSDNKVKQRMASKLAHERGREYCRKVKEKILSEMPCCICKEPRGGCLDFHHADPEEKHMSVSHCHSLRQLFNELPKCIVICSNCHRLHHKKVISIPANAPLVNAEAYLSFANSLVLKASQSRPYRSAVLVK